jgi:hypothetical protein
MLYKLIKVKSNMKLKVDPKVQVIQKVLLKKKYNKIKLVLPIELES